MPLQTVWYNPARILYTRLQGNVTAEDFLAMSTEVTALIEGTQQTAVHLIVDQQATYQTPSIATLARLFWNYRPPAQLDWVVGISKLDPHLQNSNVPAAQLFNTHWQLVPTLDYALGFLLQVDPGLQLRPPAPQFQQAWASAPKA